MKTAYTFQNGFQNNADSTYGWLRHYGLTPQWGDWVGGSISILLSDADLECLRLMARHNPARFGNESNLPE